MQYILAKGRIIITGGPDDPSDANKGADERGKGVIFKNCSPFINCKAEISNTETDNAKDIDIVMPMYNLIEYSDNYSKTSGSLWKYYRHEPDDNLTETKITGKTPNDGR